MTKGTASARALIEDGVLLPILQGAENAHDLLAALPEDAEAERCRKMLQAICTELESARQHTFGALALSSGRMVVPMNTEGEAG